MISGKISGRESSENWLSRTLICHFINVLQPRHSCYRILALCEKSNAFTTVANVTFKFDTLEPHVQWNKKGDEIPP